MLELIFLSIDLHFSWSIPVFHRPGTPTDMLPTFAADTHIGSPGSPSGVHIRLHISPILGRFGGSTAFQVAFFDLPALAALLGRGGHQKRKCPFNLRGFSNSWNERALPTLTAMMTTAVHVGRRDEEKDHGGSRVQVYISKPQ